MFIRFIHPWSAAIKGISPVTKRGSDKCNNGLIVIVYPIMDITGQYNCTSDNENELLQGQLKFIRKKAILSYYQIMNPHQ